ncbi:MAG: hypothetical protein KAI66_20645, partial [Lentisphaeria bacterium]|nr:hypothetical protein [Lentisphaeria bacterium]
MRFAPAVAVFLASCVCVLAAKPKPPVVVTVLTDRPDAVYTCGETVTFTVSVKDKGVVVETGEASVSLTLDRGRSLGKKTVVLAGGAATFTGTLDQPGFLNAIVRVKRDGKTYRGVGSAG